ncbi:MAG: cysteine-rich CWC family protein [Pseudomonadota bacterium]
MQAAPTDAFLAGPVDAIDPVDTSRCPLCGEANGCAQEVARATGMPAQPCWCMQTGVAASALARIPADARGRACVCAQCASDATPLSFIPDN